MPLEINIKKVSPVSGDQAYDWQNKIGKTGII